MKTAHLQSKLLAAAIAAVLVLPYTAPIVCGMLGRMGNQMEMAADVGAATVRAPDSAGMCCTLSECGVPQIAPVVFAFNVLQRVATVWAELPGPPSAHPVNALVPLTPPPQA